MTVVEYQDFEIEIGSDSTDGAPTDGAPSRYFAHVIRSPAGEAIRTPVQFRFSGPNELAKLRADLESAVLDGLTSRAEKVLRDFGQEVFRSIFVNVKTISNIYARSKVKDLRIKLRISSPDLAALPWEYLYEEEEIISYVSLRLPFVRYLETAGTAQTMGVRGPLRILGMISAPDSDEWPRLEVAKERERINKGIDKLQREGRVVFEWVSGGTGKDLMEKLLEGDWHIFHFIGHGGVEPQSLSSPDGNGFDQSGFIVMVDEDGSAGQEVRFRSGVDAGRCAQEPSARGSQLLRKCQDQCRRKIRQSGHRADDGGGALPAVVAMQFPVSDGAAINMSEGFYKALANNCPVDDAITMARKFIHQKSRVEFGIPVCTCVRPTAKSSKSTTRWSSPLAPLSPSRDERRTAAAARKIHVRCRGCTGFDRRAGAACAPRSGSHCRLKDDRAVGQTRYRIYLNLGTLQQRQTRLPRLRPLCLCDQARSDKPRILCCDVPISMHWWVSTRLHRLISQPPLR